MTWVLCSVLAAGQSGERPTGTGSALASPPLPWPRGISTNGQGAGRILPALLGSGQVPRACNHPGSPIPHLLHVTVNRRRFPGTSPGCGKRKLPAMRHLLTPSVAVFRLFAAPRVGCGALMIHRLLGQPHGDPHTPPRQHPGPLVCTDMKQQQPQGISPSPLQCCRAGGRASSPHPRGAPRSRGGDLKTTHLPAPLPRWTVGAASCSQGVSLLVRRLLFGWNKTGHIT